MKNQRDRAIFINKPDLKKRRFAHYLPLVGFFDPSQPLRNPLLTALSPNSASYEPS
ncbi:MAG TPA: hypothetical protein PLE92_03465 [Lentisphaeria bacterium]|nr:hypothetical protein [Lentisphaeria bacterium]HQC52164.1 hypothetical protein [Lentisphaeria bacterium]